MTIEEFVNQNIELIDENKWDELYRSAMDIGRRSHWFAGQLTDLLLAADIDPLNSGLCIRVPDAYLNESKLEEFTIPNNIQIIGYGAFYRSIVTKITIPTSIIKIESNAFISLPAGCQIIYNGTVSEFDNIDIEYPGQFGGKQVICSDGIWEFQSKNI